MSRAALVCAGFCLLAGNAAPASEPVDARSAVARALPLLRSGAKGHIAQRTCFACHNQFLPMLAGTVARERGFVVPEEDCREQQAFIAEFLARNRENYLQGKGQGGQVDTAGYALLTLELGGWKADAATEAVVEYLLRRDKDLDHWRTTGTRPPSEASDFTPTYLALRALRHWGTPAQKERIDRRIETVRRWLAKAPVKDTEDRVFRLWALRAAQAEPKERQAAVQELVRTQRQDGGWGQIDALASDAYATGSALVALHQAGKMPASAAVYRRGVAFLLKNQLPDGSWLVHSRSKPFQTYYESGFPHAKDQFISIAATGWATTALALTVPETPRLQPRLSPAPKKNADSAPAAASFFDGL